MTQVTVFELRLSLNINVRLFTFSVTLLLSYFIRLSEKHKELLDIIKKFRDDEMDHHDTGLAHDAEKFPAYNLLFNVIKAGCKVAIAASERV